MRRFKVIFHRVTNEVLVRDPFREKKTGEEHEHSEWWVERLAAAGAVAQVFQARRNADRHEQADQHWRDVHAPLALTVHKAMTNYTQLSILHCFTGPEWNGFALCGFDTESDLRDHFFDSPEGKEAIRNDIAKFANTRKSPRRIIAKEYLCQD